MPNDEAQELQKEFREDVREALRGLSEKIDGLNDKIDENSRVYATIETTNGIDLRLEKIEGDRKIIIGGAVVLQFIGGFAIWLITTVFGSGK